MIAFPTNDELFAIFAAWPIGEFSRVRRSIEIEFQTVIESDSQLTDRVSQGRREEPFYGSADVPNFFRKPFGNGWALVGDAGYHRDPALAHGVADAFRDAALLAESIDSWIVGRASYADAMTDYEVRRNEDAKPKYRANLEAARFNKPPDFVFRLRKALRGNVEATRRMYMANEGMIPEEEFYAPERIASLMSDSRG